MNTIDPSSLTAALNLYQAIDARVGFLVNMLMLIATIFGVIVAVVIAFFAIRQWNADKEIAAHKETLREEAAQAKEATLEHKKRLASLVKSTQSKVKKADELIKALEDKAQGKNQDDNKEIKQLKKELEALRDDISYNRAAIDLSSGGFASTNGLGGFGIQSNPQSPLVDIIFTSIKCEKCGKIYKQDSANMVYSTSQTVSLTTDLNRTPSFDIKFCCPHCGHEQ